MLVTISKDAYKPHHSNIYVVTLSFMHGDRTDFQTIEVLGSRDQIEPVLRFLTAMDRHRNCPFIRRLTTRSTIGLSWKDFDCAFVVEGRSIPVPAMADHDHARFKWPKDSTDPLNCDDAFLEGWSLAWHEADGSIHKCKVTGTTPIETKDTVYER